MISFQNFSFRYEESKNFTLRGIDMTVRTGEFILLTGRSGCGKTTLIRSLNGLIPHFYPGEIKGDLLMDGHSLLEMKPSELAGQVGTVFQDPRSQFFMTDTTRELAFGCENLGLAREETIDRIARAVKELELVEYLNRSIFALSSGEKQQIAIGSVYALAPKVYIFDEPSANLDYAATKRLAEIMEKLKSAGYTIFVVEHRFYYLRDLIDRAFLIHVLFERTAWFDCCRRHGSGMAGVKRNEQGFPAGSRRAAGAERTADRCGAILCGGHWRHQELQPAGRKIRRTD